MDRLLQKVSQLEDKVVTDSKSLNKTVAGSTNNVLLNRLRQNLRGVQNNDDVSSVASRQSSDRAQHAKSMLGRLMKKQY